MATPQQAQEFHAALRSWLAENVSQNVADTTRIVYWLDRSPLTILKS